MSLIKARAKIDNIRNRVIPFGKKDRLHLIDRNTYEILAQVNLWSWKRLNPLQKGGAEYQFKITATSETKEFLPSCLIAFNGVVHDVPVRNAPESVNGIQWKLQTLPTNEKVEI